MPTKEIIIRPKPRWQLIDLEEIWVYRELFYILAWRDLKVRYKQTVLGVIWVIFQPLVSTIIFTIFFGNLAKIPSGKLPYSLFVLIGLVFWTYFSSVLTHSSDSMISNESIIKKVYFPKIILPLSSAVTGLVDFIINMIILTVFALFLGFIPSVWLIILLPLSILITAVTAVGLGLLLASLNVKYRDVRYILPFFIQLLLFLTPVIYPLAIISDKNKYIMSLNPLTSVIELIRGVFSGSVVLPVTFIIISISSSFIILLTGMWNFRRTEQFFADIV